MRPMLGEQVWDGPTQRATHEIVTLYVGNKMILEHVVHILQKRAWGHCVFSLKDKCSKFLLKDESVNWWIRSIKGSVDLQPQESLGWRQLGSNVRRGDRGGYCRPRPRFRGSLSRMDGGDYLPILSHLCCILKIFRFIKTIGVAISDLQILLPLILTSLLPPMGGQPQ